MSGFYYKVEQPKPPLFKFADTFTHCKVCNDLHDRYRGYMITYCPRGPLDPVWFVCSSLCADMFILGRM